MGLWKLCGVLMCLIIIKILLEGVYGVSGQLTDNNWPQITVPTNIVGNKVNISINTLSIV